MILNILQAIQILQIGRFFRRGEEKKAGPHAAGPPLNLLVQEYTARSGGAEILRQEQNSLGRELADNPRAALSVALAERISVSVLVASFCS